MGAGGWRCEIFESVTRIVSASFALLNSAPSLAFAAEDRTFFMMEKRTWIAPFEGGGGA